MHLATSFSAACVCSLDHKCERDASVASCFSVDCSEPPSSVGPLGTGPGLVSSVTLCSRASLPGSLGCLRDVGLRASVSVSGSLGLGLLLLATGPTKLLARTNLLLRRFGSASALRRSKETTRAGAVLGLAGAVPGLTLAGLAGLGGGLSKWTVAKEKDGPFIESVEEERMRVVVLSFGLVALSGFTLRLCFGWLKRSPKSTVVSRSARGVRGASSHAKGPTSLANNRGSTSVQSAGCDPQRLVCLWPLWPCVHI